VRDGTIIREGAKVVVSGRREKEGQELAAELRALGAEAVFVRTDVRNDDDVRKLVDETVSGRDSYLRRPISARLGEVQVLEGSWTPNMIVIVEFPNLERARVWYHSPEYALALEMQRQRAQPQSHSRGWGEPTCCCEMTAGFAATH
jgi:uncharacterized protein (DUF1330 family)